MEKEALTSQVLDALEDVIDRNWGSTSSTLA